MTVRKFLAELWLALGRRSRTPLPTRTPGASLLWWPNHPDSPVTIAGDRAALRVMLAQKARDDRYPGRARHAQATLTEITGEYQLVRPVEYAAVGA